MGVTQYSRGNPRRSWFMMMIDNVIKVHGYSSSAAGGTPLQARTNVRSAGHSINNNGYWVITIV